MILQQYIGKYFNIFNRKKEYKIMTQTKTQKDKLELKY